MVTPEELIVLHYTRFSEKSVVLHTLSQSHGRRSYMIKDASRLIAYFQPLAILSCEVVDNPKSSLSYARAFVEAVPLTGIRMSMGKNAISMFMAEVMYRALKEGVDEPGLYEWCRSEILLLDRMNADYSNFHVRFLVDFASAMGFGPSYEGVLPFLENQAPAVNGFIGTEFAESMLIRLTGDQRSEICMRLLKYLEFHLETPLHIRSLGVLGELF